MSASFNDLLSDNRKLLSELNSQLGKLRMALSSFQGENAKAFGSLQVSETSVGVIDEHQAVSSEE